MVRNIEKLIKLERPREISEMKLDTPEVFSTIPKLDLMDMEPCTEQGIAVHVDLGLDQLEEQEE
ncbi:hypothetical protein MUO98_08635 [Candidatus Bathyarchaeota archaeon]|nr:hypothetical protein [Candidatus Bathyarchaeota archaeon]